MKRILIYLLVFSLLLITCGGAVLSEADLTSTSAEELLQAGKFAEANGNYEKALEYYQLAADQEDAEALWFIGSLYYYGYGVEQSYEKALEYFQRAAEMGNVRALNSIGYMYLDGEGVDQDYQKALECIQSAVDQGEIHAQKNMGHMYLYGLGVDQDYEKALEYYRLAADQGLGDAFIGLGDLYRDGRGVEQDDGKAAEYYGKALELGIDIHRILQEKVMAYLFVLNIELPFCFRYNDCAFNTRMKANSRKAEITYG